MTKALDDRRRERVPEGASSLRERVARIIEPNTFRSLLLEHPEKFGHLPEILELRKNGALAQADAILALPELGGSYHAGVKDAGARILEFLAASEAAERARDEAQKEAHSLRRHLVEAQDEVERLQSEMAAWAADTTAADKAAADYAALNDAFNSNYVDLSAALAEVERLKSELADAREDIDNWIEVLALQIAVDALEKVRRHLDEGEVHAVRCVTLEALSALKSDPTPSADQEDGVRPVLPASPSAPSVADAVAYWRRPENRAEAERLGFVAPPDQQEGEKNNG